MDDVENAQIEELREIQKSTDPAAFAQVMKMVREWAKLNPRKEQVRLRLVRRLNG